MIKKSDASSALFDSIVAALLSSYDEYQITTTQGKADCSTIVSFLGTMAKKGYLKGASLTSRQFYAEISSQFLSSAGSAASATTTVSNHVYMQVNGGVDSGGLQFDVAATTNNKTQKVAWPFTAFPSTAPTVGNVAAEALTKNTKTATAGLTSGTLQTMVPGQGAVPVVTDNVRATMNYELVSAQKNADLGPPQTEAEVAYAAPMPKFQFVGDALKQCNFPGGYSQLSTSNYGSNPNPGSQDVKSPLLAIGSTSDTPTTKARRLTNTQDATELSTEVETAPAPTNTTVHTVQVPLYYIILQYASTQNFNHTAIKLHHKNANITLPACRLAKNGKYVSCGNCNITTFTNHNVTYGCYDMKNICPKSSFSGHRRLEDIDDYDDNEWDIPHFLSPYASPGARHYHALGLLEEGDDEDVGFAGIDGIIVKEIDAMIATSPLPRGRRRLQADDATDDGGGPKAGDDFGGGSSSSGGGATIAMLLLAIAAELKAVLSSNPFANFDLNKAAPVLAFVGCIIGSCLFGIAYFLKWDKLERHLQVYLRQARAKENRLKIEEDLLAGGSGVPAELNDMFAFFDTIGGKSTKHEANSTRFKSSSNAGVQKNATDAAFNSSSKSAREDAHNATANLSAATTEELRESDGRRSSRSFVFGTLSFLQEEIKKEDKDAKLWEERGLKSSGTRFPILVAEFSNMMISEDIRMDREKFNEDELARTKNSPPATTLFDTIHTLRFKHYLTAPWTGNPSLRMTRTLRFIELIKVVLCNLFIDTLIFGIFFPADGTCNNYVTKKTCELAPSMVIAGATLCTWEDEKKSCGPTEPPGNVVFLLIIAFLILIVGKPFDIGLTIFLEEVLQKRPAFDKWKGWPKFNMDSWFGSVAHKRY